MSWFDTKNVIDMYEKNREKHHKEFWKKMLSLDNLMSEREIEIASKYLDICKKYIETHEDEGELILIPIVVKIICVDKKWPHETFSPQRIVEYYRNVSVKVKERYFNEIQLKKFDWEAEAVRLTAKFFSKNKTDKRWGF